MGGKPRSRVVEMIEVAKCWGRPKKVRVLARKGVWAVTRSIIPTGAEPHRFVVTHIPTGCAVKQGIDTKERATELMDKLAQEAPRFGTNFKHNPAYGWKPRESPMSLRIREIRESFLGVAR